MPPKKAVAPRPKVGGQQAAKDRKNEAKQSVKVTVADTGVSFTYNLLTIPIAVRVKIRDLFSQSVEQWLGERGRPQVDTYADLWWVTRLDAEPSLTRGEVHAEWEQRCAGVSLGDITEELVPLPEAQGQPS